MQAAVDRSAAGSNPARGANHVNRLLDCLNSLTEQFTKSQAAGGVAGTRPAGCGLPREPLLTVAVIVLYVGLEWLSFLHEHDGLPVTPWSPGLGVIFAAIVLKGPYYGLVFFIGVLVTHLVVLQSELPWLGVLANSFA